MQLKPQDARSLRIGAWLVMASATAVLSACGAGATDDSSAKDAAGPVTVKVGDLAGDAAEPVKLTVKPDAKAIASLPADVKKSGTLKIGVGALPAGFPPLAFVGDDDKTLTGAEPDFARLVAATLGLKADVQNTSWENLFVGLDSGKFDVGFSNIGVTEERKDKYDFASYRKGQHAFLVLKSADWNFDGDPQVLAGRTIATGSGTIQEKLLLAWADQLKKEGAKPLKVVYFQDNHSAVLAIQSKKVDGYFGPNPGAVYTVKQNESSSDPLRIAGTFSSGGASLQGLVGATTKKDSGVAAPIAEAVNHLIETGQYAAWLKAYNLSTESVEKSEVNPPGLPRTNA